VIFFFFFVLLWQDITSYIYIRRADFFWPRHIILLDSVYLNTYIIIIYSNWLKWKSRMIKLFFDLLRGPYFTRYVWSLYTIIYKYTVGLVIDSCCSRGHFINPRSQCNRDRSYIITSWYYPNIIIDYIETHAFSVLIWTYIIIVVGMCICRSRIVFRFYPISHVLTRPRRIAVRRTRMLSVGMHTARADVINIWPRTIITF
jgi:hypothetical protein